MFLNLIIIIGLGRIKIPNNNAPTMNFAVASSSKNSQEKQDLHCRFCNVNGHTNLYCPNYLTCDARIKKCKELKICIHCTSLRHESEHCHGLQNKLWKPCKFCSSKGHTSALCPKRVVSKPMNTYACLSTSAGQKSNYLLPVLSITMQGRGVRRLPLMLFSTLPVVGLI